MADYTDIDKLRELAEKHRPTRMRWIHAEDGDVRFKYGDGCKVCEERDVCTIGSLVAELVGLRTEVDQLRGDNERHERIFEAVRDLYWRFVRYGDDKYLVTRGTVHRLIGAMQGNEQRCSFRADDTEFEYDPKPDEVLDAAIADAFHQREIVRELHAEVAALQARIDAIREARSCLGAGPMDYEAFTDEVDRALAAAVPDEERDPKIMAMMAKAALRVELAEIDAGLREHGLDEMDGKTLADRLRFHFGCLANLRPDGDASQIAANVYQGAALGVNPQKEEQA